MTASSPTAAPGGVTAPPDELALLRALRAGDEAAFASLVERHYSSLLRVAMTYVGSRAVAEEVVQDTWVGVLRGLDRFEGRSSLKTWIFRILTNTAKTRAEREGRTIPFSSLAGDGSDDASVDPDRFFDGAHTAWAGHWESYPRSWSDIPENRLVSRETRERIDRAIDGLPPNQRIVIRLRDVEGFSSEEVCRLLNVSETNQRVLLHRARSRVRASIEGYIESGGDA